MELPENKEARDKLTGRWVVSTHYRQEVTERLRPPNHLNIEWRKPWTVGVIAGFGQGNLVMVQQPSGCPAMYEADELTLLNNPSTRILDTSKVEWEPVGDGRYHASNKMFPLGEAGSGFYGRLYHYDAEGCDGNIPDSVMVVLSGSTH